MKNTLIKNVTATAAIVLFTIISAASTAAQGRNTDTGGGGGRLEGTWDARVKIFVCQTGAEIRSFDSLGIFMQGGTMIDSTSGVPQSLKTPGHGIWQHLEGRTYRFKFKAFTFDPAGNYTGFQVITHEATLDRSGDSYVSEGTAEFFAPNGTRVMVGCSSTTAERFSF